MNEEVKESKKKKKKDGEAIVIKEDLQEEKVVGNSSKSTKTNIILYIIIFILILVLAGLITWVVKPADYGLVGETTNDNSQVELKKTEAVKVKSEGVYITDVSEVVEEVMPSIVAITSKTIVNSGRFGRSYYGNNKYTTEGAGSGVIIDATSDQILILTNYHVVENTNELSVKFIDDESYDAKIIGVSERKDIAVVSVSKKKMKSSTLEQIKIATLGSSDELKVGNGIIAIGNALGYGQSVTMGIVSALNREVSTDDYVQKMIQIDAPINGGNSGGALFNSKGEVVGINTAKYSSNSSYTSTSIEGMGFAIPISDVKSTIQDLINGKNDTGALTLGIEGYMTNTTLMDYGLPVGFYISKIDSSGNIAKTDIEIGNIITEIDNNKVTSLEVIKKVLNSKDVGDKVTLKVQYPSKNEYKEKEIIVILK